MCLHIVMKVTRCSYDCELNRIHFNTHIWMWIKPYQFQNSLVLDNTKWIGEDRVCQEGWFGGFQVKGFVIFENSYFFTQADFLRR